MRNIPKINSPVKLTVEHHRVRSTDELDSFIEEKIMALHERLPIEEARISLAFHYEESPAYTVRVHLITPGPDIFTEGRDHTLRAAMQKAVLDLETNIIDRALKRKRRVRGNLQAPAVSRMERRLVVR